MTKVAKTDDERIAYLITLAKDDNFLIPSSPPSSWERSQRFIVVSRYRDMRDDTSEWVKSPYVAAEIFRRRLEYTGWRDIQVWDLDLQEQVYFQLSVTIIYNDMQRCETKSTGDVLR